MSLAPVKPFGMQLIDGMPIYNSTKTVTDEVQLLAVTGAQNICQRVRKLATVVKVLLQLRLSAMQ